MSCTGIGWTVFPTFDLSCWVNIDGAEAVETGVHGPHVAKRLCDGVEFVSHCFSPNGLVASAASAVADAEGKNL